MSHSSTAINNIPLTIWADRKMLKVRGQNYKDIILKRGSHKCHKKIVWKNDDDLSKLKFKEKNLNI